MRPATAICGIGGAMIGGALAAEPTLVPLLMCGIVTFALGVITR